MNRPDLLQVRCPSCGKRSSMRWHVRDDGAPVADCHWCGDGLTGSRDDRALVDLALAEEAAYRSALMAFGSLISNLRGGETVDFGALEMLERWEREALEGRLAYLVQKPEARRRVVIREDVSFMCLVATGMIVLIWSLIWLGTR